MGTMRNASRRRLSERRVADNRNDAKVHKVPEDHSSVADTDTASIGSVDDLDLQLGAFRALQIMNKSEGSVTACDACEFCNDCCGNADCDSCRSKELAMTRMCSPCAPQNEKRCYTMCQVRRHNHIKSAWLVAGKTIYDATPYLSGHPGGLDSILRKAGGAEDCSRDLMFHSALGKRMFKRYEIGEVRACGCSGSRSSNSPDGQWWSLWWR
jgi:cytochrome b involved in lipid metabolism